MSKDKQLTPVMQAIKDSKIKVEELATKMSQDKYNSDYILWDRQKEFWEDHIEQLESLLPAEKKAMIEFAKDYLVTDDWALSAKSMFNKTFKTEEG